jgi:UDP-glucose 4-epimerase
MNKYFITGGAGFIGREIVKQLLQQRKQVVVYDDFSFGRMANLEEFGANSSLQIYTGKVEDFNTLNLAIAESAPDIILHMAALHFIPYCNSHPLETLKVNVEGTYSLLEAAVVNKVQKIVSVSSGAIYSSTENELIENIEIARPVDVYGCSKWLTENLGEYFTNKSKVQIVTVRLFNTYGPFETNEHIIPEIMKQLHRGNILYLGNTATMRDYIYVEDTATGFIKLAQANISEKHAIVNLGTGTEYSAKDIVSFISKKLKREIKIETDPARFRPVDKMHQIASTSLLCKYTGWKPTIALESGLEKLLQFEKLIS